MIKPDFEMPDYRLINFLEQSLTEVMERFIQWMNQPSGDFLGHNNAFYVLADTISIAYNSECGDYALQVLAGKVNKAEVKK